MIGDFNIADNWQLILVLGLVLTLAVVVYKEILRTSTTFLLVIAVLAVSGVLNTKEVLAGFANEQIAVIILLLVVGNVLRNSPAIEYAFQFLFKGVTSYYSFLARMMGYVAGLSAFMNNTPLVAILMPYVHNWGKQNKISSSKLLIPLSFAAILGGGITLIGTATNLIANGIYQQFGFESLNLFDFALVGIPLAIVGIVYLLLASKKLLPDSSNMENSVENANREYLVELVVKENSSLIGKSVKNADLRNLNGLYLVEIVRGDKAILPVSPEEIVEGNDTLIFAGETEKVIELLDANIGLQMPHDVNEIREKREFVEVVVPYNSSLVGSLVKESNFRGKYDAAIIAIRRDGEKLFGKIGEITLRKGDMLLCVTGSDFESRADTRSELYVISKLGLEHKMNSSKSAILIVGVVLAIGLSAFKFISLFNALLILLAVILVAKITTIAELRKKIDFNLVIIMAGAMALGQAMQNSGAAKFIAQNGLEYIHPFGPIAIFVGLYLMTSLLAAYITNIAAVTIILPIALEYAVAQNLAPLPFVLLVAFAGSKNFITPIGYQTNLMVYGLGGYKFKDYMRIGWPLLLIGMAVTVSMLVMFY